MGFRTRSVRMTSPVDEWLVDDALDAYVCWRERQAAVWDSYERWCAACVAEAPREFAAYRSALDREEVAAGRYADRITRLEGSLSPGA
jgi:hypothetical protein